MTVLAGLSALVFGTALAPRAEAANTVLYWDADGNTSPATGGTGAWDTTSSLWRLSTTTGALQTYTNTTPSTITADFGGTAGTVTIATGTTINVNAITFETAGYTIAGTDATSILNLSGTTPAINNSIGTDTISAAVTGTTGVTLGGTGTTNLTGTLGYTGATVINAGVVGMSGTGSLGQISLSQTAGNTATLNFAPTGTIALGANDLLVGAGANSSGVANQTAGTVTQGGGNQFVLGSGSTSAYGSYNISGGAVSIGTLRAGGTGGSAEGNSYFQVTGGTITGQGNTILNRNSSGTNVLYINGSGAAYNTATSLYMGYAGSGTGVATINAGTFKAGVSALFGNAGYTGTGILNLNGGTLNTPVLTQGAGTSVFNFNGGTLQASAATATFMSGLGSANVYSGGGTIDTNGNNITIGQAFLATGGTMGVKTIPVSGGSGYIGAPVVSITGGSGTGASAVANLSGGTVTSITITSAGTGYNTTPPTIALVGGLGSGGTAATLGPITTGMAAADGGLTKIGAGILTLTGANTYSGGTRINGGTLLANSTSGGLTSSATGTGAVAVGNAAGTLTGILGGTGSVLGAITVNPGSTITGGTVGTVGTLTAQSNLTLAGTAGTPVNFTVDITGATADRLVISGILSLSNASITFTGTPTASSYVLATYSSETGGTFAGAAPGGYQLQYNANELDLVAVPEPSTWAGVAFCGGLLGLAQRRSRTAASARLALSLPF